jgi:hypothetical protein
MDHRALSLCTRSRHTHRPRGVRRPAALCEDRPWIGVVYSTARVDTSLGDRVPAPRTNRSLLSGRPGLPGLHVLPPRTPTFRPNRVISRGKSRNPQVALETLSTSG